MTETAAAPSTAPANQLPLRTNTNIQGNILAGFNKDNQVILFLHFPDANSGRQWLKELIPSISNNKDVADFNDKFSAARRQNNGKDSATLKATWVAVSLTFEGLTTLAPQVKGIDASSAFAKGPADPNRVRDLGDDDPSNWVIGRPDQHVHALLTIAADDPADLQKKVSDMQALAKKHNLVTIRLEAGATLPGALRGHEHFGFKDGISQPGVRGFNTPDASNKQDRDHPGSALIFAGEFVFGYPKQGSLNEDSSQPSESLPAQTVPQWMKDGSFQVFRRLKQDVPGFGTQVLAMMDALQTAHPGMQFSQELVGAKLVGRWASGAPLDIAPDHDTGVVDNTFRFHNKDAHGNVIKGPDGSPVQDSDGLRCPRFAHIRKVYPRGDGFGDEFHRIIRRGIPFGMPYDPGKGPGFEAEDERGLLFMAFMTSIENQFEFLQQAWVNPLSFPDGSAGHDPVIGIDQDMTLTVHHQPPNGQKVTCPVDFPRFTQTTGAVYAFAPSLDTLKDLANGQVKQ